MKAVNKKSILALFLFFSLIMLANNSYSNIFAQGDDEYFLVTDKAAAPVGGVEGLSKKVLAEVSVKGKGKIYLLVYVNETGEVDDIKVVKGIGGKENEVIEIVKKTKFTPGMNGNTPVKSKVAMALNFN